MKENISSVEYANNWYGESWKNEVPADLELLKDSLFFESNPLLLLENLHEQLGADVQNLIKILTCSGEGLINSIQEEINNLTQKAEEQIASLFLREKFGEPGDPLVSVVFAQLAQREVLTKRASKNNAIEITKLSKNFEKSILQQLKILIANQINKIEEKHKNYKKVEKDSEKISNETPEITEQMRGYRSKFVEQFQNFEKEKKSLLNLYKKIDEHLFSEKNKNQSRVIFELAQQNTSPTAL
jgi:hypothetical protein